MKKYLIFLIILLFTSCIREQQGTENSGFSFTYRDVISSPYSVFSFSPFQKGEDLKIDFNYQIDKKEFDEFISKTPFFSFMGEEEKKIFFEKGFFLVESELFPGTTNLVNAYSLIQNSGYGVYISADSVGLIFENLMGKTKEYVEKEYNFQILKRLLISLMHQSLKEYEQNVGLLKEAAWRNTAFLCVALRLIDNNSPTPFIVSGIVRKELNLINRAEGILPSPLLSIDDIESGEIKEEHCFDYSLFKAYGGKKSRFKNFSRSYLWLSNFKFNLKEKMGFLQTVLLTQCIKDVYVNVNDRDRSGDELWGLLYGFYRFFGGTDEYVNLYDISIFLSKNGKLLESFYESQSEKNLKELKSLFLRKSRNHFLTFFPPISNSYSHYFKDILYPHVGPDVSSDTFKFLLKSASNFKCGKINLKSSGRCNKLTEKDFKCLYCIAMGLRFKRSEVFKIFKLFPTAEDFLFSSGFINISDVDGNFCRYHRELIRYRKKVERSTLFSLNSLILKSAISLYRDWEKFGRKFSQPSLDKCEMMSLNMFNFKYKEGGFPQFSYPGNKNVEYFLEPSPFFYGFLADVLDFLRKKLLMEGLSDLKFDDYLIQYVNILEELKKISIEELRNGKLDEMGDLFLKNIFNRIIFVEKNGPLIRELKNTLDIEFPLVKIYGRREDINRRFLGCSSQLHYAVILRKYKDGTIHYFLTPISIPFQLIVSRDKSVSEKELMEILKSGNYLRVKKFNWIYEYILH